MEAERKASNYCKVIFLAETKTLALVLFNEIKIVIVRHFAQYITVNHVIMSVYVIMF